MEKLMSAAEAQARIEREADERAIQDTRHVEKIDVGQVVRQGDIYIHRVAATHGHGKELKTRQLAIGETMGSRHIAEAPCAVYAGITPPEWAPRALLGPCIESEGRFTVGHPEHAHVSLPPGRYQVTHQLDAATQQRVAD